jgi:signal transduction histidine kinase
MTQGLRLLLILASLSLYRQPGPLLAKRMEVTPVSWEKLKQDGRGTITVYWYESRPFIYQTSAGIEGIEYEIMEGFRKYLRDQYHYDLRIEWKEARSFADTYAQVRDKRVSGIFGASAFSITPERQQEVAFSQTYMSDISVLITSSGIPIVQNNDEFNRIFSKLTAITIHETTYEQDVLELKRQGNLPFRMQYIPSSQNVLQAIGERDSAFGFIDLPVYMMMFNENPSIKVQRQNLFPVKRKGYAVIFPQTSDWGEPLKAYFDNPGFSAELEKIIGHYFDIELYHFIERLAVQSNDLVVLLTKEKEIQSKDLIGKSQQIEKEARARNFLIVLASIILVFLVLIILLYRKRSQQKLKIEQQRKSIELKNEQLEKRNHHLVTLDEEKNNLIKILAHDLRTPINHVQGLAQVFLLTNTDLPDDQRSIIERITEASVRLNKMINNILDIDSIENNRVRIFMDEVAIGPLVSQVVRSFDKQAARKNIDITEVISVNGARIRGDSLFLIQVFENLVSNAIKFSPKGGKIGVTATERDGAIRISVKDNGPGLTEEDQQMLFKKFQRLSAKPTDGENSTGLGLSIVRKYVELMGGRVWCESYAGKGADFIVEFPTPQSVALN